MIKVSANIFSKNGGKRRIITGEVLDLFWDSLDEDILDNKFQEQIENDLEVVNKLKKHVILVNYYFVAYFVKNLLCFHSSIFFFSNFNLPLL